MSRNRVNQPLEADVDVLSKFHCPHSFSTRVQKINRHEFFKTHLLPPIPSYVQLDPTGLARSDGNVSATMKQEKSQV